MNSVYDSKNLFLWFINFPKFASLIWILKMNLLLKHMVTQSIEQMEV